MLFSPYTFRIRSLPISTIDYYSRVQYHRVNLRWVHRLIRPLIRFNWPQGERHPRLGSDRTGISRGSPLFHQCRWSFCLGDHESRSLRWTLSGTCILPELIDYQININRSRQNDINHCSYENSPVWCWLLLNCTEKNAMRKRFLPWWLISCRASISLAPSNSLPCVPRRGDLVYWTGKRLRDWNTWINGENEI